MFKLLKERRFAPFFWTMGLGAFNDNLYKSALVILIAYSLPKAEADILVQASAGLFILPFFIFSGISGQVCDKYEKSMLMGRIKILEIFIMALAALGLYMNWIYFLMIMLFLMGAQSTLFGPVKYSILPQHLKTDELLAGNSLTSMGTFVSILVGTILGGILASKSTIDSYGTAPIGIFVFVTAIVGWFTSRFIPSATPAAPDLVIKKNPLTETLRTVKLSAVNDSTLFSILGISWFWFFGFFFMASLPSYCRDALAGDEKVATLLLTFISIGMGAGSLLCNKLSGGDTRPGLVIFGGLGLTLFSFDIFLTGKTFSGEMSGYLAIDEFVKNPQNIRAGFDLLMIGLFGGIFIVPLYTLLQQKAPRDLGSQLIASNNIVNAIFMVTAAVSAIVLFALGLDILQIFLIVSLVNLLVTAIIFFAYPRYFYHVFFMLLMRVMYRYKVVGKDNLPDEGPVIVVSNHVSFIDPFIIAGAMNRPPRYVMDKSYFDWKPIQWFFRQTESIPITPKKIDPEFLEKALDEVAAALEKGEMVTIFPEGFITKNGDVIEFKDGVERILDRVDATVVPVAIKGMWGSWFSRIKGKALKGLPPNRLWANVELQIGKPFEKGKFSMNCLRQEIIEMRGEMK